MDKKYWSENYFDKKIILSNLFYYKLFLLKTPRVSKKPAARPEPISEWARPSAPI